MHITVDQSHLVFRLDTKASTLAFMVDPLTKSLQRIHWGEKLSMSDVDLSHLISDTQVLSFDAGTKNAMLLEFSGGSDSAVLLMDCC